MWTSLRPSAIEPHIDTTAQRSLEANLATMTDSSELLKAEIGKEEALLAKETKQLQEMEKNAKRAETEKKRQMKNVRLTLAVELQVFLRLTTRSKEHAVLRHLDGLPESQDQKPAEFTLADLKDVDATFSEVIFLCCLSCSLG